MSSEFLEDVEDNEKNVVLLTYQVGGYADLTMMDDDKDGACEGNILRFGLTPDEKGWANAKKIADALNDWIEHTKRIMD